MTFQQLTYVVEVSKCGSINKAAHKLFLSQSGISTAVRELEQELGIQFFTRSNRGVEFTPEGREFLGYAVSLLEQKQRIQELYKEDRSAPAVSFYGRCLYRNAAAHRGRPLPLHHQGHQHGRRHFRRV